MMLTMINPAETCYNPVMSEEKDELLTTAQVAEELDVSIGRVQALINNNQLRATKFGRQWSIARADLENFKAVRRTKAGRPKGKK